MCTKVRAAGHPSRLMLCGLLDFDSQDLFAFNAFVIVPCVFVLNYKKKGG